MQTSLLNLHCSKFASIDEENRIEHTLIHQEYTEELEALIESELKLRLNSDFDMCKFLDDLSDSGQVPAIGDALEALTTLTDYSAFKMMMVEHRSINNFESSNAELIVTGKGIQI